MSQGLRWFGAVVVGTAAFCGVGCAREFVDEQYLEASLDAVGVVTAVRATTRPLVEATQGRIKPGETVRFGAWNIQWLDSSEEGGRRAQRAADLAAYVAASGVDALGVAEIGAQVAEGVWQSATLNEVVELLSKRTGETWRYLLFPNANGDLRQLVGVVWNQGRVQMLGWNAAEIDRSGDARIWHRHPVGVKFSAGRGLSDFVMIPVHMKCCLAADQRAEEARTLVAALPAMRSYFRDDDVFIIGDANMFDGGETAAEVYREAGFVDLNAKDRATHVQGFPFDRAFVPREPEFEGVGMRVFAREFLRARRLKVGHFRDGYSDHFMIWIDVKVMGDDD